MALSPSTSPPGSRVGEDGARWRLEAARIGRGVLLLQLGLGALEVHPRPRRRCNGRQSRRSREHFSESRDEPQHEDGVAHVSVRVAHVSVAQIEEVVVLIALGLFYWRPWPSPWGSRTAACAWGRQGPRRAPHLPGGSRPPARWRRLRRAGPSKSFSSLSRAARVGAKAHPVEFKLKSASVSIFRLFKRKRQLRPLRANRVTL